MRILGWFLLTSIAFLIGAILVYQPDSASRIRVVIGVLAALSVPLVLVGLFGIVLVICLIRLRYDTFVVHRRIRKSGRLATRSQARSILADRRGTILIEAPTVGWNVFAIWWTPDDVAAEAPAEPTEAEFQDLERIAKHPFILWCMERYLDHEHGSALLLETLHGYRKPRRIESKYSGFGRMWVNTGIVNHFSAVHQAKPSNPAPNPDSP